MTVGLHHSHDNLRRTIASVREEAAGDSEFLPAVHRLSNRVRARLGEALADIELSARALEKVTTPSLSALQLFSEADGLIRLRKDDVAEGLLRQAVAEDPEFASGYMHLAHTIRNQGRPATEYLPPAERAVALAERVSERERYFILGSYHSMVGQDEQALTVYEALVCLYPDHDWGTNNLANINRGLGRREEARRWSVRLADLRPTNVVANVVGATALLGIGDVAAAEPYVERAFALISAEGADPLQVMAASFLKGDAAWVGRDAEQALAALNEVVASGPPQTGTARLRDRWLHTASLGYLRLGMLDAAHDMAVQSNGEYADNCALLYHVAWARDDRRAARDHLRCVVRNATFSPFSRTRALIWLARAGAPDEVREALEGWQAECLAPEPRAPVVGSIRWHWSTQMSESSIARARLCGPGGMTDLLLILMGTVRGELARLEGRVGEAIPLLEPGVAKIPVFFLASDSLALAWLAQGEPSRAARVLDEAAQVPPLSTRGVGFAWLTVELRRAQAYRQLGRVVEAEQIEAGLRRLLAHADPDHVILRALKRPS